MARRCRALALIVTWAARVIPGGLLYLAKANPGSGEESRGRAAQRTPFGGWLWSGPMILAGTCLGTGTFRKTLSSRTGRPVNARVNHSYPVHGRGLLRKFVLGQPFVSAVTGTQQAAR